MKRDVVEHLICEGFQDYYYWWRFHGEVSSSQNLTREDMSSMNVTITMTIHGMLNKDYLGFQKI